MITILCNKRNGLTSYLGYNYLFCILFGLLLPKNRKIYTEWRIGFNFDASFPFFLLSFVAHMACLPPELINEVVKYFRKDFLTLHSCILVNRQWCRSAIPLLWESPFTNPTQNCHFIEIYLHKLSEH